ncbi:MAG: hypothetical protein AB7E49_04980 [Campylobacterales bacterium]
MRFFLPLFIPLLLLAWEVPDRRKDQFVAEQGYLFMPAPYSMPGIGEGVAFYGGFNNYLGQSDLFGVQTVGDAEGTLLGLWDLHLIKRRWFVDVTYLNFSKTGINQYSVRGMDSSSDDYAVAAMDRFENLIIKNTLAFDERRFEISAEYVRQRFRLTELLDADGNLLSSIDDPKLRSGENISLRVLWDLTDDRQDPLRGVRMGAELSKSPRSSSADPDFYTLGLNVAGYIPVGRQSTWVWSYMASQANVSARGELDRAAIAANLGYGCYPACSQAALEQIENEYLYNRYGNAKDLGGENRLRAYPGGRFKGAHSQMIGTELRLNFSAERKPVDFLLMRDIRTGIQLALFHEVGTVAERASDLWSETRSASGLGVRFVMGSGFVYRFDYAVGDEGSQMVIFVSYPWEEL